MRRLIAGAVAALIITAGASWALPSTAANAAECPVTKTLPVTVTIPDIGQSGPGDTATPAPTPTACPTATPTPAPSAKPPGGTAPGAPTSGGSTTAGSTSGSGAAVPAAPAGPAGEVVAPTPPSKPTDNAAKLELNPERLSVKEWMIAKGNGYTAGENVQFVLYPGAEVIGSYLADASGNVTARFRIPDETRLGSHVLEATGWASTRVSNGKFTVVSVTVAGAETVAPLWWVIVLCGALLFGLIVMALYFRHSIARAFHGGADAAGAAAVGSTP